MDTPTDDLPTPRSMAPTASVHVWCKACRHSVDADLDALIRDTRGTDAYGTNCWQSVTATGFAAIVPE
jgi:hypothetical protein